MQKTEVGSFNEMIGSIGSIIESLIGSFVEEYGGRLGDQRQVKSMLESMPMASAVSVMADYSNKFDLEDSARVLNESREWANGRW